jgi:hypothetical protein
MRGDPTAARESYDSMNVVGEAVNDKQHLRLNAGPLFHPLFCPKPQFFRRNIFKMSCNPPMIACEVLHTGATIAIKLVCWFSKRDCSHLKRSLIDGIDILNIDGD